MQLCVIFQVTSFKDKVTCFRLPLPLVQSLSCARHFSTPWTSSSPGKWQKLWQRTWTLGWKLLNEKGRLNRPWSKATYSPTQPWATTYLRVSLGRKINFYLCLSLCLESLCHNSLSCGYIKSWWANILFNVTKVNNGASLLAQLVKKSACNAGDLGLISGSGSSPGEGNGNPLQYSCLENSMDRGAWQAIVHGIIRVRHDLATKPPLPNEQ